MVWTFRSSLLDPTWRSWDCIAGTKEKLLALCLKKYGRVPIDVIPVEVSISEVPEAFRWNAETVREA